MKRTWLFGVTATLVSVLVGCGVGESGQMRSGAQSRWVMNLEPPSKPDAAQPVVAFVFTRADSEADVPADTIIIEGEASIASIRRYTEGELTDTLAERIVPSSISEIPGKLTLRPLQSLALGQRYTVLSRAGVLGSIVVNPAVELSYLVRIWPPRDSSEPALQTIYCGDVAPTEAAAIELFPSGHALVEPGLDGAGNASGNCVRVLALTGDLGPVQPPASLGEFAFEPSRWSPGAELPEIQPLQCEAEEWRFGPGCLGFSEAQPVVRAPASTTFWALRSTLGWHMHAVEGGGKFTLPISANQGDLGLDVWTFDLAGRLFASALTIAPPPIAAQIVINEVMANPLGAEPAEEWIEIVNAGTGAGEMVGWRLRDQAGDVEIPPVFLDPSAMALLVRHDFVGGLSGDVPPDIDCALLRLPSLGRNGLSNSGETVELLDQTGSVVSRFPARTSGREGVSLARRSPTELDDASDGFAMHASPGASPCRPNLVE